MPVSETELPAPCVNSTTRSGWSGPLNYDRTAASLAFAGLVHRLETDFGTPCESEQDTQDSSEYGRVRVPARATTCGTPIVVCVSKFGSLAETCAHNPGAFLGTQEAREQGALDPSDLATAEQALARLGYVSIPEELLESDYDGPSALEHLTARPTWWTRYFGDM